MTVATHYTIMLKKFSQKRVEKAAGGTITPGHLVMLNSSDALVVHSTAGGTVAPVMFAVEDELQGGTVSDDYSSADRVQAEIFDRGEEVYAIIADSQTITIGDKLVSYGDGTLAEMDSVAASDLIDYPNRLVAIALEAVTTSGAVSRCRCMVV